MFYDMQKVLNAVKNCAFKCLAENATVSAATPYPCKTQLLKRIYLKSERSVFTSDNNGHRRITSSLVKNRIVTIGFKRRTTSPVLDHFNIQHRDDIKNIKYYMDKKNNLLNSTHAHCRVTSIKHTNLYENKTVKKMHNGDEGSSMNSDRADNSIKSDKADNNHDDNFVDMTSPLSEWSNWTYYTNNKKRDPTKNTNDVISEDNIHSRLFFESNNQFDFLPRKLYGLLHRRHIKLTNVKCFNSPNDTIPRK